MTIYYIPDPVKNCMVYQADGCAHVDGMLCNMLTCPITYVSPIDNKVISPNGVVYLEVIELK